MSCFSCFRKTNQVYPIVIENEGIDFKNKMYDMFDKYRN